MESADTTSPPRALASATASFVLPEAVGPLMTKIFGGIRATSAVSYVVLGIGHMVTPSRAARRSPKNPSI